ncbi:MAG: hypothetical protein GEU81_07165 [Nitriliruptorales bacterium]|nr:hypothetical protein [Nitriliruptorales bacterium]
MNDVHDQFTAAAELAGSRVHRLPGWTEVAELALDLATDGHVVVGPTLAGTHKAFADALGNRVRVPVSGSPAEVADAPVGVMHCPLAVVETGSTLVSEHMLGDRLVSMLSRTLLQIVASSALVASLDDVGEWLSAQQGAGYWALVTGPSRTADIERSLTIGVQGPQENHVILLEGT